MPELFYSRKVQVEAHTQVIYILTKQYIILLDIGFYSFCMTSSNTNN